MLLTGIEAQLRLAMFEMAAEQTEGRSSSA